MPARVGLAPWTPTVVGATSPVADLVGAANRGRALSGGAPGPCRPMGVARASAGTDWCAVGATDCRGQWVGHDRYRQLGLLIRVEEARDQVPGYLPVFLGKSSVVGEQGTFFSIDHRNIGGFELE